MNYLIIGTIVGLIGVGLMINGSSLVGLILLLVGLAIGLKGRRSLDS